MKSLGEFVVELLYENQCVIIPEFGAFVSNRKVAELLKNSTMVPPTKEISFNARLNVNDGLLVKHIAQAENISYEAAQNYIKSEIDNWKYILDKGQELVVEKIGKFHKAEEESLIFEPFSKENFLTETFGMAAVAATELTQTNFTKTQAASADALTENPMATKEEKKRPFVLPSWAKYAVAGAVGLGIIYYGVYAFLNSITKPSAEIAASGVANGQKISEALEETKTKINDLRERIINKDLVFADDTDSVPQTAVALSEKQRELKQEKARLEAQEAARQKRLAQKQESAKTEKTQTAKIPAFDSSPYHLIAGAFSTLTNAQNKVSELKKDGFKDAVVVGKNAKGLFLVSFKGFNDDNQARKYISKVKENGYDTWLYKKD